MSSRVGPSPPVVSTAPVRPSASATATRIASGRSATDTRRVTCTPFSARVRAISAPLVSTVNPSSSSVPMVTSSMFMERTASLLGPVGKQPAISVEVNGEGVHSQQGGAGQCHRDEAAVEFVPVLGVLIVLPPHRLAGIPKGEPENHGTHEDVLDRRFQLARAGGGNHDASPAGPPPECGHGQLTSDQQETDPEGDASPDRNVVEVVALPGNP